MTKFYLLDTLGDANDDRLVQIEDYVVGIEMDDWRTGFGERAGRDWPIDATIVLRKTSGRTLTDVLGTTKNTLFASNALRQVIERHCKGLQIEYLPFELRDYRKRLLSKDYVIVNPIGTVDCLNLKASEILWDEDDPRKALAVNRVVLSEEKLRSAPALFRVREAPVKLVISFEVANELYEGKYTNVYWERLEVE